MPLIDRPPDQNYWPWNRRRGARGGHGVVPRNLPGGAFMLGRVPIISPDYPGNPQYLIIILHLFKIKGVNSIIWNLPT